MNGTTVVPKDVIDSIKGKDTTLVLDMGNGLSWKILERILLMQLEILILM